MRQRLIGFETIENLGLAVGRAILDQCVPD
jgi:hypothetical protein